MWEDLWGKTSETYNYQGDTDIMHMSELEVLEGHGRPFLLIHRGLCGFREVVKGRIKSIKISVLVGEMWDEKNPRLCAEGFTVYTDVNVN